LRAPQFTGGGVVHGPTPRSYAQRTPKKMKAAALRGALSDRARNDRVHVVSAFVEGDAPSTKAAAAILAKVAASRRVLVVASRRDEASAWKSLRNIPTVHLLDPGQLNTYDVMVSDDVVFTEAALTGFLGRLGIDVVTLPAPPAEPDADRDAAAEVTAAADAAGQDAPAGETSETGEEEDK
jgi:large subunit ribosomal protein L4